MIAMPTCRGSHSFIHRNLIKSLITWNSVQTPTQEPDRPGRQQRTQASRKQSPNLLQHWAGLQTLRTETQAHHKPQLRARPVVSLKIHDCTPQKLRSPVPDPRCTELPPMDSPSWMWWQLGLMANLWGKQKSFRKTISAQSWKALIWWVKTSPKRWSRARAWRMRDAPIMAHIAADREAQ